LNPILKKNTINCLNIEQDLTRAVEFGIPFEELVGVDDYLESIATDFSEVTYLMDRLKAPTFNQLGLDLLPFHILNGMIAV